MTQNKIREYRCKAGISQTELTALLPNSPSNTVLSLIENGHVLPTRETMRVICDVLDCKPYDLYNAEDLELMPTENERGGERTDEITASVKLSSEVVKAMKELGYSSFNEWLNEAQRTLLRSCEIKRMNKLFDTK